MFSQTWESQLTANCYTQEEFCINTLRTLPDLWVPAPCPGNYGDVSWKQMYTRKQFLTCSSYRYEEQLKNEGEQQAFFFSWKWYGYYWWQDSSCRQAKYNSLVLLFVVVVVASLFFFFHLWWFYLMTNSTFRDTVKKFSSTKRSLNKNLKPFSHVSLQFHACLTTLPSCHMQSSAQSLCNCAGFPWNPTDMLSSAVTVSQHHTMLMWLKGHYSRTGSYLDMGEQAKGTHDCLHLLI